LDTLVRLVNPQVTPVPPAAQSFGAKAGLDYITHTSELTQLESSILEQTLINEAGGKGTPGLLNRINSMAPKYWDMYGIPRP
jgi:hypothetical protein